MDIHSLIKEKLQSSLQPEHLEVINESDLHIGHAGHDGSGQSHFQLIVVSSAFDGYSRMERQKYVYQELDNLFSRGLHALSMKLFTPDEYRKK